MNVTPSGPNDPRMARLGDALRASVKALAKFRGAMRGVNDTALQEAAAPVIDTAELILKQHEKRAEHTIADDVANLRAAFSQLPIPREDADLGPLPGLDALRSARGNLREEFHEILEAARALGWRPSETALPDIAVTEIPTQGLEGQLRALVARMESVEQLLDQSIKPEGEASPERTTIQIALVQVFVKNMKMELALAKLEARLKNTVDLAALGRAIENVSELTADFIVTVRGVARKMTAALREASERLRPRVRKVARGFGIVVGRVASLFARAKRDEVAPEPRQMPEAPPPAPPERPDDFDMGKVREMIFAGVAPPAQWRPWIHELVFTRKKLEDLSPLAGLTALRLLVLSKTQASDLAPLAGLTALKWLNLHGTQAKDLAPLAGLTALETLNLMNTQVSDLAPLAGLKVEKIWVESEERRAALARTLGARGDIVKVLK